MEEPKVVLVDVDILNRVVSYMAGKPYAEVAELIAGIQNSVTNNRQNPPKENE